MLISARNLAAGGMGNEANGSCPMVLLHPGRAEIGNVPQRSAVGDASEALAGAEELDDSNPTRDHTTRMPR